MNRMTGRQTTKAKPPSVSRHGVMLQRQCACGAGTSSITGECEDCRAQSLRGIQAKLRVSEPDDVCEKEADLVAREVMRSTSSERVSGDAAPSPRSLVQRRVSGNGGAVIEVPSIAEAVLSSPGEPLDAKTRAFFEPKFGHDFSRVRVHADSIGSQAARSLDADAYTSGEHVVFASGRYVPGTQMGKTLLAHELTHVVQQRVSFSGSRWIHRSPCTEKYPTAWTSSGETRGPDRTSVGQLSRINPALAEGLRHIVWDADHPEKEVTDCPPGRGQRFAAEEGNNQGVVAVELCQPIQGGLLEYRFICEGETEEIEGAQQQIDETPQFKVIDWTSHQYGPHSMGIIEISFPPPPRRRAWYIRTGTGGEAGFGQPGAGDPAPFHGAMYVEVVNPDGTPVAPEEHAKWFIKPKVGGRLDTGDKAVMEWLKTQPRSEPSTTIEEKNDVNDLGDIEQVNAWLRANGIEVGGGFTPGEVFNVSHPQKGTRFYKVVSIP